MEDVFESIFLLRKEHILPLQGVIWADLLTAEVVAAVVVEIATVVEVVEIVMAVEIVTVVVVVAAEEEVTAAADADDHLPHTIEEAAAVVVAVQEEEGIIVQDPDLIHLVDIERGQTGYNVVEIFKKNIKILKKE